MTKENTNNSTKTHHDYKNTLKLNVNKTIYHNDVNSAETPCSGSDGIPETCCYDNNSIKLLSECSERENVIADIRKFEQEIKDLEDTLAEKKPLLAKKRRVLQDVVEPELRKLAKDFGFIVMAKGRAKGKIRKNTQLVGSEIDTDKDTDSIDQTDFGS